MERTRKLILRFTDRIGLNSKSEKRWFCVAFCLLVLYTAAISLMQLIEFSSLNVLTAGVTIIAVPFVCFSAIYLLGKLVLIDSDTVKNKNKRICFFLVVFALSFTLLFFWQKAFWPGSFSPDSIDQYKQVLNASYSDWHPVLHTWLFFGLPMLFSDSPALIVSFQIVWFSLSIAYLYYVLYDNGCNKVFILLSYLFIFANPNTAFIMLFPWKDSALTIFATVIFTHLIRIYNTNGKWLFKWYNLGSFTLFLFLANSVRHNSILLIAPLLIVLFVFLKNSRKRIVFSAALLILATFVLKVPIYSLANVESPDRRQTEILGLPMTVLQNIYMEDRDALDNDARKFMDSLATQENWEKYHNFSEFNSIKWSDKQIPYKIENESAGKILQYTLDGALHNPYLTLRSLISLTSMVWSIDGSKGWNIWYGVTNNEVGINAEYGVFSDSLRSYANVTNSYVTRYLFNFIGVVILLLLFSAVAKIGRKGLPKAFTVIPILCYNFGTMLLLTGYDFRFFHLNFVIVVPLLYLLFSQQKSDNLTP